MTPSPSESQAQTSIFDNYTMPKDFMAMRVPSYSRSISSKDTEPETAQEAIQRSVDHADPALKEAVMDIICDLCQTRENFTSDDILFALVDRGMSTEKTKFIGGLIPQAARLKWCRKTSETRPSKWPPCHGRDKRIWESLIFSPAA